VVLHAVYKTPLGGADERAPEPAAAVAGALGRGAEFAPRGGDRAERGGAPDPFGQEAIMRCAEIMKTDLECVSVRDGAGDAARRMRDRNIGFLPVCDDSGKVVGTLTDRDIAVRVVAEEMPPSTPVETVMSREVVACRPQDDISEAEQLMASHRISRILCIDEERRPTGVISLSDIAQEDAEEASRLLREVSEREAGV
jgi:CBS domain-containing protein